MTDRTTGLLSEEIVETFPLKVKGGPLDGQTFTGVQYADGMFDILEENQDLDPYVIDVTSPVPCLEYLGDKVKDGQWVGEGCPGDQS